MTSLQSCRILIPRCLLWRWEPRQFLISKNPTSTLTQHPSCALFSTNRQNCPLHIIHATHNTPQPRESGSGKNHAQQFITRPEDASGYPLQLFGATRASAPAENVDPTAILKDPGVDRNI